MRQSGIALAGLLLALGLSGCSSLNTFEKQEFAAMKASGCVVEEKSPAVAAGLGLLPGGGSFYTRQYALGVLDLFTWPLSVCWDPFIAYHEANAINYQASKAYAHRLKHRQMQDLDASLATGQINQVQYVQQKRALDAQYGD